MAGSDAAKAPPKSAFTDACAEEEDMPQLLSSPPLSPADAAGDDMPTLLSEDTTASVDESAGRAARPTKSLRFTFPEDDALKAKTNGAGGGLAGLIRPAAPPIRGGAASCGAPIRAGAALAGARPAPTPFNMVGGSAQMAGACADITNNWDTHCMYGLDDIMGFNPEDVDAVPPAAGPTGWTGPRVGGAENRCGMRGGVIEPVREPVAAPTEQWEVRGEVRMRDEGEGEWLRGVVTELGEDPPRSLRVRLPDGDDDSGRPYHQVQTLRISGHHGKLAMEQFEEKYGCKPLPGGELRWQREWEQAPPAVKKLSGEAGGQHEPPNKPWRKMKDACAVCNDPGHLSPECDPDRVNKWIRDMCLKSNMGKRRAIGLFKRGRVEKVMRAYRREEKEQKEKAAETGEAAPAAPVGVVPVDAGAAAPATDAAAAAAPAARTTSGGQLSLPRTMSCPYDATPLTPAPTWDPVSEIGGLPTSGWSQPPPPGHRGEEFDDASEPGPQ